jgi:hypothetical protein
MNRIVPADAAQATQPLSLEPAVIICLNCPKACLMVESAAPGLAFSRMSTDASSGWFLGVIAGDDDVDLRGVKWLAA